MCLCNFVSVPGKTDASGTKVIHNPPWSYIAICLQMSWRFLVVKVNESSLSSPCNFTRQHLYLIPLSPPKSNQERLVLMFAFIWLLFFANIEDRAALQVDQDDLLKQIFNWACLGWQLCLHRDMIQSYMILGLVDTLSPALDSQFREARRELRQKLGELKERPPLVRREGDIFSILGHILIYF